MELTVVLAEVLLIFSKSVGMASLHTFYSPVYQSFLKVEVLPLYHGQFFPLSKRVL